MNLADFYFSKYKFIIEAREEIFLPEYKGSTLRGAFGYAFKKITCIAKNKDCKECILKEKCVYSSVFESRDKAMPCPYSRILIKSADIPRPFVIEPPEDKNRKYRPDDKLQFNLILIGKAIDYLPYFIFTFDELGKIGIGKNRGKYELKEVLNYKDEVIYTSCDKVLKNTEDRIKVEELIKSKQSVRQCHCDEQGDEAISLRFLTPARIKYQEHFIMSPEFHIIIKTLLQRISTLSYFYCNGELDVDYKTLIKKAEEVKIKNKNLKWYEFERYSKRQDSKMKLGGFIGNITYEGDMSEFLPFILIGEYVHIGKQTTFGLGKYEVIV